MATITKSTLSEPRLELLLEVASQLLRAEDPAAVISSVAARACEVVGCELFLNFLLVPTPTGTRLRLNSAMGVPPNVEKAMQWYDLGLPICGIVAQSGKECVWDHSVPNSPPKLLENIALLGIKAYTCFPLLIGTRVVGTLGFGIRTRDSFTAAEVNLLRSVADPIALAMERVESEAALRAARDQALAARITAEAANSAKDRFLAALSHELRTPLTPISTTLDLLDSHPNLPPDIREDLQLIRRNLRNEITLIDDLLDYNRIARDKVALNTEPVDLPELVASTLKSFRHELAAKRFHISTSFSPLPHLPIVDPLRIRQILSNLLTNAMKFTPDNGTISIDLRLQGSDHLALSVTDTGIGIPADVLPQLFTPFEQLNRPSRPEGLGLGLVISKSLAELHHGSLTASSPGENRGATFTLTLPFNSAPRTSPQIATSTRSSSTPPPTPAVAPPPPPAAGPVEPKVHLLLVDDHADTLRVMSRYLTSAGYDVTTATSVGTALSAFASRPADFLISDIGLPDGTGHDLLRTLRTEHPALPALAVSGFGMDEDLRRSSEAGFAAHLTKPIDLQTLRNTLSQLTH